MNEHFATATQVRSAVAANVLNPTQQLAASRLRPTLARTSVLAALADVAPNSLDTNELFRVLNQQPSFVAPCTIYRALHDLWNAGLLVRTWGEQGRARYGIKPSPISTPKDTLGCQCGERLVFIEDDILRDHLRSLAGKAGFSIDGSSAFTISMACAGCGKNGKVAS